MASIPRTLRCMCTTTTTRPRCCWPRCTPPVSNGWCWRVRWWSTARGGTGAPTHGIVRPGARRASDMDAGRYEPRCPTCEAALGWQPVPEDAPLEPQSTYAATKVAQEHLAAAWARQTGGSAWAMRYHNVYGPRMPRDTPYAGVASIFRSALVAGRLRRSSRTAGSSVTSCTSRTSPGRTCWRSSADRGLPAVNVCSGDPHTVGEFAATLATAMAGQDPLVVGGARPADVRHIVASPRLATDLSDSGRWSRLPTVSPRSPVDELRAPATLR